MKRTRQLLLGTAAVLWAVPAFAQAQYPTAQPNINAPGTVVLCSTTDNNFVPCGSPGATALPVVDATRFARKDVGTAVSVSVPYNTVNTQSTATATPQAGQFVYIVGLYLAACQDATGGAVSNVNWTTTNLGGAEWPISAAAAASTCTQQPGVLMFATPVKSAAPGTAVTISIPNRRRPHRLLGNHVLVQRPLIGANNKWTTTNRCSTF
jgi:hypothetical protein